MIFERLRAILAEQFAINENSITMDTTFVDDLGVIAIYGIGIDSRVVPKAGADTLGIIVEGLSHA